MLGLSLTAGDVKPSHNLADCFPIPIGDLKFTWAVQLEAGSEFELEISLGRIALLCEVEFELLPLFENECRLGVVEDGDLHLELRVALVLLSALSPALQKLLAPIDGEGDRRRSDATGRGRGRGRGPSTIGVILTDANEDLSFNLPPVTASSSTAASSLKQPSPLLSTTFSSANVPHSERQQLSMMQKKKKA